MMGSKSELTLAEQKLVECAKTGAVADYGL
jgi:hypothetical protein